MLKTCIPDLVFSTCVEVIPKEHENETNQLCILHVCGGDPVGAGAFENDTTYSPRVWR